jgi:glycosyltransferase involved in cell wall biosynthesis
MTRVAYYAPMKPPTHPTPSGDRRIARLTLAALETAGYAPFLASDLRSLDMTGSRDRQSALIAEAELEVERLVEDLAPDPPAFWFTYHCYWKAPDLIGPQVARTLGVPYLISEASHNPARRKSDWAVFAEVADFALQAADVLFWTTLRDLPGLERVRTARQRLVHLPAFVDPGPPPHRREIDGPIRLLTVAMMRQGDKLASYQALADALAHLDRLDWRLAIIGDGPARPQVEALFRDFRGRVEFTGRVDDAKLLRRAYEASELFVWPGVNEGVGMVYLEAQAAGLACLAEARPGPRDVIHEGAWLPQADNAAAFAAAIREAASDREGLARRGAMARDYVLRRHSLDAAAETIRAAVEAIL